MRAIVRIQRHLAAALIGLVMAATPTLAQTATQYFPITPCRVFSSFDGDGVPLIGGERPGRQITVKEACGIPSDATAVSYNVTVVDPSAAGFLTLYPSDRALPIVSSINFEAGDVRGNGGVVPLSAAAADDLNVYLATAPPGHVSHVIIDASGYFKEVSLE